MTVDCGLSTVDSCNELQKPIKQIHGVMRPRPCLRVVLDRRAGDVLQDQALDRPVVEIQMRELRCAEVRLPTHRLVALEMRLPVWSADREAVVLARDVDLPGGQ